MKKFIICLIICFLTTISANASTNIKVEATEHFSTANPSKEFDVKILEDVNVHEHALKAGSTLRCKVNKVVPPKRGKRNAYFYLCPYQYVDNWNIVTIQEEYIGKYTKNVISKNEIKNIDKGKAAKKVVSQVGGFFVKGFGQGISLAEGMIKNEEGNRLVSGVQQVYKDSPLSYVENGEEIEINPGDVFYLKFKSGDSDKYDD